MSASRLLSLLGASIFHSGASLSPPHPIRFNNLLSPRLSPLRFRRYISSSAAVDNISGNSLETSSSDSHHPWPEWVAFVDRLQAKGYFAGNSSSAAAAEEEEGEDGGGGGFYKDMNVLKDASLSFARDRFDIFKSLSREDIQTVVGSGCPNLLRKAVNSAKRLRAYVRLDEGDVCSACNLRGSCDRAYVILKETEAEARTVDVVRILLFYALDPLVISGGEMPPGRALVEASARNLLSDLIVLSETSPNHTLPKAAVQASHKKDRSLNFINDEFSTDVEMKRGDWMCPKCSFMNFSRNVRCLKCKTEGPKRVSVDDVEMKKGDWNCPQCGFMNFASNRKCLRCREQRPKRQLNPGEWECPSCDFLNYRKNIVCLKCDCERPKDVSTQYEDQLWHRPN
ncbi:zinc finger protein VAR3, chloroplastic isoform X2 [Camellia sinensis]|uniref:zinc finger protein VAR3, chloroplastic isoform X2 n=1 Tax=Camellia sinensis TaxID=4442 RepID=UPI0010359361|nr:zinc finger protein VAR3, chloroplastic isoform X2 [Camellia sinensis]